MKTGKVIGFEFGEITEDEWAGAGSERPLLCVSWNGDERGEKEKSNRCVPHGRGQNCNGEARVCKNFPGLKVFFL